MNDKKRAPALERGINIIELLEKYLGGLSFSGIHRRLKIPKPSLVRFLHVLLKRKFLKQDNKIYKLGLKFLSLGSEVQSSLDLREIASPFMKQLLRKIDETVELEIFDDGSLLVIEKIESSNSIRLFSKIGGRYENLYASAPGKVVLAFLPEKENLKWLKTHSLTKITPYTITNLEELKEELIEIKNKKIAFDFQEARLEVSRIASPLFNHNSEIAGVIDIAGPYFRINQKDKDKLGSIVKEFANKISKELGYKKDVK